MAATSSTLDIIGASSSSTNRPEINGLRALAVVVVIVNHFNQNLLPGGYLGVDIFFVISGYVITASLVNRPANDFSDFLVGFYTRRIKRLAPALVLCVVITSIAISMVNQQPGASLSTGRLALFGLSNFYLYRQAIDYFGAAAELNVFTHTWSLGVEEQFYLLFPFLLWFSGFHRLAANWSKHFFWLLSLLAILSLCSFVILNNTNQPAAFFLMPARFWELGSGCLLFFGLKRADNGLKAFLAKVNSLLVLAVIVAVLFTPLQYSVQATIAVVLLTALLIACLRPKTAGYSILTLPPVIYIGLISYSLYLWSWSVLSISRWTTGIDWWTAPIQAVVMLLLAVASYHLLEKPLRYTRWSNSRHKTIAYGITAASTALAFSLYLSAGAAQQLLIFPPKWDLAQVNAEPVCVFSHKGHWQTDTDKRKVVFIGDSHAGQLCKSVITAMSDEASYRYSSMSIVHSSDLPPDSDQMAFNSDSSQYMHPAKIARAFGSQDIAIFSLSRDRFKWQCKLDAIPRSCDDLKSLNQLKEFLQSLSQLLNQKGTRLLLVGDVPKLCTPEEYVRGMQFKPMTICSVSEQASKTDAIQLHNIYRHIAQTQNATFLDTHPYLCRRGTCNGVMNGKPIYRDHSPHFNDDGGTLLTTMFKNYFDK